MPDYKREWLLKSEIDYFNHFISLWLACNSWYRSHYSDMGIVDRVLIDKIKTDFTGRNHLYTAFKKKIDDNDRNFKTNLELLHKALCRANIKPDKLLKECSFNSLLPDYSKKDKIEGYINIVISPSIKKSGEVSATYGGLVTKLDEMYISSNLDIVFPGIFELIYQIRNQLMHGNLNPDKDNHEVVKYCYMILYDLMSKL